ncbi:uncharacterized protein CCOS01_04639 [Colletotrichum costaricense]|uniref:Cysteine-rich transmembrane CYSTM domain-containing protein n=1 Tax=Colletotrichum costaricense TaxID=1209916 RepID=A0AAJ0E4M4_9PEZI|nr:uncharacterized protein CCOS01_04639 [Colletotrichum costaricense]KAK1532656.1 hypothetical protein CCOS01_04639 [Colletotrichum costaricense]
MASNDYYNQGGNYNNQNYGPPQGGYPQHPQAAYGPPQGGYQQQQGGYYPQGGPPPMQYQQQPPMQAPRQKKQGGGNCLTACLAALCCCCVIDETCECCAEWQEEGKFMEIDGPISRGLSHGSIGLDWRKANSQKNTKPETTK